MMVDRESHNEKEAICFCPRLINYIPCDGFTSYEFLGLHLVLQNVRVCSEQLLTGMESETEVWPSAQKILCSPFQGWLMAVSSAVCV